MKANCFCSIFFLKNFTAKNRDATNTEMIIDKTAASGVRLSPINMANKTSPQPNLFFIINFVIK